MKKSLVTLLLCLATAAVAQQAPAGDPQQPAAGQQSTAPAGQQPAAGQQGAAPAGQQQQKKEIKDPAEYNAYVNAVQTQDPTQRAAGLESFLQTYPNSVMKTDALELLLGSYQQSGNAQKSVETAQRILQAEPNNLTALALLAYINRTQGLGGGPNALPMIQQAAQYGQTGLQALQTAQKPEGINDADWQKRKVTFTSIFNAAIGTAALNSKDYPTAQKALLESVNNSPNPQQQSFIDVYQLALSYLEPKPIVVDGLFWIARAAALAQQQNPQAVQQVQSYGRSKYLRYHGNEQGWQELLQAAATQQTLPQGFTVAPAPSPAEQAAEMMKSGTAPEKMSFGEWQFILSSGNQQAADTVWTAIKGKLIKMQGWYMSGSGTSIQIAGTQDAQEAGKPDIQLTLEKPLTARQTPKAGQLITFQGVLSSYTPDPFLLQMTDGAIAGQTAAAGAGAAKTGAAKSGAGAKKATPRKR